MKSNKFTRIILLGFSLVLILSACNTSTEEPATSNSALVDLEQTVSATGEVIPKQEALLSVSAGGVVEAVLVNKGDAVRAGEVLVQLEGTEQQAAALSAAELALANASFALDKLYEDTDLMAAEALHAAETSEQALEDLNNSEQQKALAIRVVADGERRLEGADKALETLTNAPTQEGIDQAYDNLLLAENKLNKTLEQIEDIEWQLKKYSGFSPVAKRLRQALKGLEIQKTQEQLAYNRAETKYNNLLDPPDVTDVKVAEAEYLTAQASLDQAQRDLDRIMDGPDAGDVAVLEAQIEIGYRDYETYNAGPDPDDIALAEARVSNAENQVAAAKAILADLELVAPFDGVISEVYINTSEWVSPGSPVLLIADLEHLQVETTDLSEIDVAKIMVGDTATIIFDALPDLALEGTVVSIAPKAAEGSGVNFPVVIQLNEIPAGLRWGMTAFVDFENSGN